MCVGVRMFFFCPVVCCAGWKAQEKEKDKGVKEGVGKECTGEGRRR